MVARSFSHRLRWLIAGMGLLLLLGVGLRVAIPIARQREAILKVESLGGVISTRLIGPQWLHEWVGYDRMEFVEEVVGIKFLTSWQSFDARAGDWQGSAPITDGPTVDDASVACIAAFPDLRHLNFCCGEISDAGLAHVASLRELETLELLGTDVSDASIGVMMELKNLRSLDLSRTKVTKSGAAELQVALPACEIRR